MRCYWGCPDSALQAYLDAQTKAVEKVKKLNPEAHATYHHPTGRYTHGWQVHIWGKPVSGMHATLVAACDEAIKILGVQHLA